jgi:centromere protein C
MVRARPAVNNDFFYQKIFGDGEFIAAGQLIIPPGGKKPPKSTKDNTYVSLHEKFGNREADLESGVLCY